MRDACKNWTFWRGSQTNSASILERYLLFDRVRSGSAYSDARSDYQSAARHREAEKTIPRAWDELVLQSDQSLIDLIAEKVVSLIGFRPTDEQIEAFLRAFSRMPGSSPSRPQPPIQKPSIMLHDLAPEDTNRELSKTPSTRTISFKLLGQSVTKPDAISAWIFTLQNLAKRDPAFLNFRDQTSTRTNAKMTFSINSTEVYPEKPDLVFQTTEISPGWWLGTNIANRDKERLLRIACEV